MTEEQYHQRLKEIESDANFRKTELYREYGISQVRFKTGDIIRSEIATILIDKISVSKGFGLPEPVYIGFQLKKDLTPRKDRNRVSIYGNNNIELIT